MQFLVKARIPIEAGNKLLRDPDFDKKIEAIVQDLKPTAVYFTLGCGQRTLYFLLNVANSSDLPAICEPLFLAFHADIEFLPCMDQADFAKAGPLIKKAAQKY